jgi:hypothetical protein
MGTAPDAIKRRVDARDMTEMPDISDLVPSPADRKVFLSGDYKEEQLRAAFLNSPSLLTRHSDFVVRTCLEGVCLVARRSDFGVWTLLSPFFTALGWDMDHVLDTVLARNWGSVPLLPYFCRFSAGDYRATEKLVLQK